MGTTHPELEEVARRLEEVAQEVRNGAIESFDIKWKASSRLTISFRSPGIKNEIVLDIRLLPTVMASASVVDRQGSL